MVWLKGSHTEGGIRTQVYSDSAFHCTAMQGNLNNRNNFLKDAIFSSLHSLSIERFVSGKRNFKMEPGVPGGPLAGGLFARAQRRKPQAEAVFPTRGGLPGRPEPVPQG